MSNLPPDWREPQHDEYTEEELEEALEELINDWDNDFTLLERIFNSEELLAAFRTGWQPEILATAASRRSEQTEDEDYEVDTIE